MNDGTAPVLMSGLYFDLHIDYSHRQIAIEGGLDMTCAPNVATAVAGLQRVAAGDITIQLDEVTFIDMTGLGVLVGVRTSQRDRGDRVIITGANPQVRRIFGLGGLADLLDTQE